MKSPILVQVDKDLEDIMAGFLKNRQKDLSEYFRCLEEKEWSTIESLAHKMAGNAGSYGLNEMGLIGSDLELACQEERIEDIKVNIEKFQFYLENLQIEFI